MLVHWEKACQHLAAASNVQILSLSVMPWGGQNARKASQTRRFVVTLATLVGMMVASEDEGRYVLVVPCTDTVAAAKRDIKAV